MNGVFKHYVIDLSCNNNFVQVPAVQGDGNNVRGFEVELISNNTQYVVDTETMIVSIAGTKPDGKEILNECEVTEDGFVLVDITSQMTSVAGRSDYSIAIMDRETNALLQSFPFYILITKSAFNANEIVSSNEFQLLTHTVVEAKNTIDDMRELEAEVTENEEARKLAESNRVLAENERELAEQKREEDTATAIENTEKATEDAIIATEMANDAADRTNEAIRNAETATENTNTAIELANQATENTINAIANANTATQNANEAVERIENLEQSWVDSENIRMQNENERIQNEQERQQSLEELNEATTNTITATNRANAISEDLEDKLASGYFNGKDGVIMKLEQDECAFSIVDDCLILTYDDGT